MDTSKTSSIKSLLLQAWREHWSDVRWGIKIKTVLPRGVSGDVYDLADCILQQALVGPEPNELFLSYLMHCLSSRVVSYGAVLSSIGRYQSFYKPYCILCLLDLLKTIQSRIGCHGNEEECIALCKAVVCVTYWLYSCIFHSITKLVELKQSPVELKQSPEHISIMEKSYEALFYFGNSTFIKSLLYVGKFEDQSMYTQMVQKHQELENTVNQVQSVNVPKDTVEVALRLVSFVDSLPIVAPNITLSGTPKKQSLVSSLNVMVSIDAILNPANDVLCFVEQLLLLKKLQNLSLPILYCEIIRACFMGIVDAAGSTEDLKWAAFTFLKVPHILHKIHSLYADNSGEEGTHGLECGLDRLLKSTPLLDLTDSKSKCDCFQYLLNELLKLNLLSDSQMRRFLARRKEDSYRQNLSGQEQQTGQANATLILRAEPTVNSILKSLESDYSKIQDALLGILCHMIPGKNFELILSAAAAVGKLRIFSAKLILFNEYILASEGGKASCTRALLFDITFLMLCHIAQHYGIEVVTSNAETKDSFFVTWATECLSEGGKYKSPDTILARCDQTSVDTLLTHLLNTEQDFKTNQVKWHEICINAPAAIKEILLAWEYGALATEKVKVILDHVKTHMCCLPVCISAWLCNYINVLHHQERLKPKNMLQHFMTPLLVDSVASPAESPASGSGRQTPQHSGVDQSNQFYKERSTLMASIIKKMVYDLQAPPQAKTHQGKPWQAKPVSPHGLTVSTPLGEIIDDVFHSVHCRGWIDSKSNQYLDVLFRVGGARWLCVTLVRHILNFQHLDDIHRAVDLVFGMFHLDIEQCALALLLHVVPFYLYSEHYQMKLAEPYGSALSRLTVMTTYAALQSRQSSSTPGRITGTKRTHQEFDIEDNWDPNDHARSSKTRRVVTDVEHLEDTPFALQSLSDDHLRNTVTNPINKAIADLMRHLMVVALDSNVSARSVFPILFLEQVVLCAKDQASAILQFMPFGLVGQLIKIYPEGFSYELVLAVSSMQSPRARKLAALNLCQVAIAHKVVGK